MTDVVPSEGANLFLFVNEANAGAGRAATAVHDARPKKASCIFYGDGSPGSATPATVPGVVARQD